MSLVYGHDGSDQYSEQPKKEPNRPFLIRRAPVPHEGQMVGGRSQAGFVHALWGRFLATFA